MKRKLSEVLLPSLKELEKQLGTPPELMPVVPSTDSDFCHEAISHGWLTEQQVAHAVERYRLGRSKSGRCIYWMIDEKGVVRDGHIGDSWVWLMMKRREPELLKDTYARHCLFGQHLLAGNEQPVCIVEKERSAVVLSELFPQSIWLASAYASNLDFTAFEPLKGHPVTLCPHTDDTMSNYITHLELADMVRESLGINVAVTDFLEDQASPEQKSREVDLMEFLFDKP